MSFFYEIRASDDTVLKHNGLQPQYVQMNKEVGTGFHVLLRLAKATKVPAEFNPHKFRR